MENINFCSYCGNKLPESAVVCPRCGSSLPNLKVITSNKNKIVAALLAIFLGTIGIHKFYLGKPFQGLFYILLCWTFIPSVISFIEGIIYLPMSDENFYRKYG